MTSERNKEGRRRREHEQTGREMAREAERTSERQGPMPVQK